MKQPDMAIVVISFDKYADIWDSFVECMNKFWKNRTYTTYLVTNHLEPKYEDIVILKTGDETSWSNRVRLALNDIYEEYVLLLLEDYLIDESVDFTKVKQALQYACDNELDYLRIAPIPKMHVDKYDKFATEITPKTLYGINLQAAIWKKAYLVKVLGDQEYSAWEFEARQKFGAETRIDGRCKATNEFVVHYLNGIIQGKWYIKTVESMAQKGIQISLGNRGIMTDGDMMRENIRNFFAHNLPPALIRKIKPWAKKIGFKFVT